MKVEIPAKELLAASRIANPRDARSVLQAVQIVAENGYYEIRATDSYKALIFSGKIEGHHVEGSVLINVSEIKNAVKASDHMVKVEAEGLNVTLTPKTKKGALRATITISGMEGNYPGMKQLFEGEPAKDRGFSAAFDPGYMADVSAAIEKAYGKAPMKLELRGDKKPCLITARGPKEGSECKALLMPMRIM